MASGESCFNTLIEFAIRKVICAENAVAADVFHTDNKFHSLPDQMGKDIEAFIASVRHEDSRYRIIITVYHGIERLPLVEFLLSLHEEICVGVVEDVI